MPCGEVVEAWAEAFCGDDRAMETFWPVGCGPEAECAMVDAGRCVEELAGMAEAPVVEAGRCAVVGEAVAGAVAER